MRLGKRLNPPQHASSQSPRLFRRLPSRRRVAIRTPRVSGTGDAQCTLPYRTVYLRNFKWQVLERLGATSGWRACILQGLQPAKISRKSRGKSRRSEQRLPLRATRRQPPRGPYQHRSVGLPLDWHCHRDPVSTSDTVKRDIQGPRFRPCVPLRQHQPAKNL